MAKEFNKTYSITLKFGYEGGADITDADLHCVEMRGFIKKWVEEKVGHIQQGDLSINIVGEVSEV